MKIVFFGTPGFSCESLRLIALSAHQIAGVVTGEDKPRGRHLKVLPCAVKETAAGLNLPVFQCADVNAPAFVQGLARLQPDLFVVVSFGKILSKELLAVPAKGSINLHTSLLPALRGAAPIQRAIAQGDAVTGSTIMYMSEKLDAGDIILQEEMAVGPADTSGTLSGKLSRQGAKLLLRAVDMIQAGTVARFPQDETKATYARKFSREEVCVDWERAARDIHNLIRALNPKPCAHTFMRLHGKEMPVKILEAVCAPADRRGAHGEVLDVSKAGIVVKAGGGAVVLKRLQPPGKRDMDAASFVNGYQVKNGDRCTSALPA